MSETRSAYDVRLASDPDEEPVPTCSYCGAELETYRHYCDDSCAYNAGHDDAEAMIAEGWTMAIEATVRTIDKLMALHREAVRVILASESIQDPDIHGYFGLLNTLAAGRVSAELEGAADKLRSRLDWWETHREREASK